MEAVPRGSVRRLRSLLVKVKKAEFEHTKARDAVSDDRLVKAGVVYDLWSEIDALLEEMDPTPREKKLNATALEIQRRMTPKGGWTYEQFRKWGVPTPPPKGWRRDLIERDALKGGQSAPPDLFS